MKHGQGKQEEIEMVPISLELPEDIDEYLRTEARRRTVSKSAVIREFLMERVRKDRSEKCAAIQSAKGR